MARRFCGKKSTQRWDLGAMVMKRGNGPLCKYTKYEFLIAFERLSWRPFKIYTCVCFIAVCAVSI
jgi:hypothetical protein